MTAKNNPTADSQSDYRSVRSDPRTPQGFTLLELLVVISIFILMATLVSPSLKGILDSINLGGSAETTSGLLSVGRQTAISRNLPTEVRIYNTGTPKSPVWNKVGLVIPASLSGKKTDEWVVPAGTLAGNIVFDPGTSSRGDSFSTVLTQTTSAPSAANLNPPGPWDAIEPATAPKLVKGLPYVAFRFQPNGSTNLPPPDGSSNNLSWCLSLKNTHSLAANDGSAPAADFVSLVIDPLSGRTLIFRP